MLRKIVDYKKLDNAQVALLIKTYPNGYGDEDIIAFKNVHDELIEAVELKTEEILYLVKISTSLANFISNFEETHENEKDLDVVLNEVQDLSFLGLDSEGTKLEINYKFEIDEDAVFE